MPPPKVEMGSCGFGSKKKCPKGKKAIPKNKKLYTSIKNKIKRRVKRWPSAYASGQLVNEYLRKNGKYRCSFGSNLGDWYREKWVNVCKPLGNGKYAKCGRKSGGTKGKYPYCRPSVRVNSKTPKTVHEMSKSKLKSMCARKQHSKSKRIMQFGNTLESFYKGTQNTFLTPDIKQCLNVIYGPEDASYTNNSYQPDIMVPFVNKVSFGKKSRKVSEERYLRSFF
jgi:hypothetical protein